jgi:hypothetical protein
MDKDAILDFIKKNIVSLSCGVVALLCVAAVFYPLGGMLDTLKQDVDAKAAVGNTLTALEKPGGRKLPIRDLDAADPGPLGYFPNSTTITAGKAANDKWKADSDLTLRAMVEMNKASHKELVPNLVVVPPRKVYEPDYLDFPETYLQILSTDPTVTGIPDKTANPKIDGDPLLVKFGDLNIQNDILHGGMPPQQKDWDDAKNALWEGTYKQQLIEANGVVVNKDEVGGRFLAEAAGLPLRLKILAARKYRVYVDQDAFNPSSKMIPHAHCELNDIWYSQLQVWIEQDIARSIAAANGSSQSVLDAPVKRLLSIQVNSPPSYTLLPAATGGSAPAAPMPASDSSPILPNYAVSPTGRYSNPLYDVVGWKLYVDVDASKVNTFLETLSRKTLMTVTCEDEYALDSEFESGKGYLYGKGAVVRLVLTGESLFFREWTKPLMPPTVKQYLGIETAGAGGATPGGGGGGQPGFGGPGGPGMGPGMGPGGGFHGGPSGFNGGH